jgi:hypothetical protein
MMEEAMRVTAKVILVAVIVFCGQAMLAQTSPVRVCVVSIVGIDAAHPSESFAKQLTAQPLPSGRVMEGVALAGNNEMDVAAQVKTERCDYVLYERLSSVGDAPSPPTYSYELKALGQKRSIVHRTYIADGFGGSIGGRHGRSIRENAAAEIATAIGARL